MHEGTLLNGDAFARGVTFRQRHFCTVKLFVRFLYFFNYSFLILYFFFNFTITVTLTVTLGH